MSGSSPKSISISGVETDITIGKELAAVAQKSKALASRDCFEQLEMYLHGRSHDRVCLLFGLLQTGKNTMLRQAIGRMTKEDLSRIAYIKARRTDNMAMMNRDLKKLFNAGFRYVFIDEVTLMEDFIDSAALFSDVFATMGMKIVLSGTDSLGFWLAMDEELYDRAKSIHTTFIPYREYIRNKEEQSIGITTAHIIEIKQYLTALELIVDCPIESADPGIEPVEHILFTQPGMRYCQAQALIHSLLKDEQFSALSEYDKTQITGRILEEVRGRMMEDIVLLETMKAADKDHRVFKLQFEAGEFDMVIYDQKENSCEIFEIKHSSKQVPFQYRHLVDEDKCQRTERRFGPIHGRYILYRGEDAQMENGVQYWNVENYLKALPTLDIVQVQEIGMQSIEPTL